MQPRFIANFLFLIFVNVLVKPIYVFGIDMKVQNVVGAEDYGTYFSIFSFSFIFYIVLDLGLTQYNSRIIAQDFSSLKTYLPNFLMAKMGLGLVFFFLIFIGAILLGYDAKELYWLGLLGAIHFLNSLTNYLRSNVAALHLFKVDAVLSIINRMLLIIVCGFMLYGTYVQHFSIEDFILAQIGTLTFTALLSLVVVGRYAGLRSLSFNKDMIVNIIKEGYPYALLVLLTTIYTRTDAVMLKEILPIQGKTEAGYYAAAYRLLDMSNMFGLLMASQLLPMFAKLIKDKQYQEISHLAQTGFRIIMFISITLSVLIAGFSQDIIGMMYDDSAYPTVYVARILSLLILSFIPIASSYVFNTLMNANASLSVLNIIGMVGVVLNIILNFILIPEHGAIGAVYATIATQGLAALAHIYFANRIMGLQLPILLFCKILLFGVLMYTTLRYGIGWGFVSGGEDGLLNHLHWFIRFILMGVLSLPLALLSGLMDLGMLKDILNKKTQGSTT